MDTTQTETTTTFLYSFDLSDFEDGHFLATRYPANCAVSGDWVCLASSNEDALKRAKKAAYEEWCAPDNRECSDFEVEFVDAVSI